MIQKFCVSAVLFLAVFFTNGPGYSNGGLFFAPTRVNLSDQNPVTEVRVTNTSKIARSYNVSLHDLVMTPEGTTTRVDNFDYSARRMVRFVPRRFDLQAGELQIVRIMARIPPDLEDGEFHSHLEFLENVRRRDALNTDVTENAGPGRAKARSGVSYATAIPLTLTKGAIQTTLDVDSLALERGVGGALSYLTMQLKRSGNGQGNAAFEVDYTALSGDTVKAGVRRKAYIYRELDARQYRFALELAEGVTLEKGGVLTLRLYNRDVSQAEPVKVVSYTVD